MTERRLFWGLVALLLIPVWSVGYFPTTDGPSHVYNAWILRQYGNVQEYPLFQQYYEIDWRPIPNWLSHAALALLMFPFDPRTAEKLLVSGYVVLLAGAARFLAGSVDLEKRPEKRWLAWLALPLIYNQLLHLGFYGFCLSVGLCLLAVGTWWRHRDRPGPGLAVKLNLLLLLCWFSHIVSLVLALASIGVLWLVTLRGRPFKRHLLHVLILAPQVVLPLWFVQAQGGVTTPAGPGSRGLWLSLLGLRVLYRFGREQVWIGIAVAVLFLVLAALTLVGRKTWREEDGFLIAALLAVVLYFVSPEGIAGGLLMKSRLSLYPWLLLIPWLAPRLGDRGRTAVLAAIGIVTVFQITMLVHWYRLLQPEIREFLAAAEPIEPDSRVLPLVFRRNAASLPVDVLGHALGWVDAEKGLVDWGNYEAMTGHFPVRFRPETGLSDIYALEAHPGELNIRAYKSRTDYVFTWRMPPGSRMNRVLGQQFKPLAEQGPARVYRRKGRKS
ncbi:MAG: hypothetical protein ABUT39_23990 [Acidobacteriota bacterium]